MGKSLILCYLPSQCMQTVDKRGHCLGAEFVFLVIGVNVAVTVGNRQGVKHDIFLLDTPNISH